MNKKIPAKKESKKPLPEKKPIPFKSKRSKVVWFLIKWGAVFTTWGLIALFLVLMYYLRDLPSFNDLEAGNKNQIIQVNYSNHERITNYGDSYSKEINYYELPQHLVNAVVAIEDRRFFKHCGVDFFGIIRAYYVNHKAKRVIQGGSTITQQLAKLLFLDPQRTFKRKLQEIILAFQLERNFTKEQILTIYLNRAYFGSGNHGIANAAKFYFGKDVSQLNLNESAMLAGLLKAPSKFSPKNNRNLAEDRSNTVLRSMIAAGFLSEDNLSEIDQDITYQVDHAQKLYFSDYVYEQFSEFLEDPTKKEKIVKITSTLDQNLQEKLENIVDKFVEKHEQSLDKSQIAIVVMDNEGAIVGMSGGKDYQQSQFNRAAYAKRQAGSSFKTFVYLAAFENGAKPDDTREDKKINIGTWLPDNYENQYFGEVTLEKAFAKSLNSVAIQLGREVGGPTIKSMARKLGIISPIDANDPTIALGTSEVTLIELTSAYATIANNGIPVIPYVISEVSNSDDELIYQRKSSGFGAVISETSQNNIKQLLHAVVEQGTGKQANIAKRNIYGKTGTSQNYRDAWFIGFDNNYITGVWIGNDNNSATKKITGGSLPAELFAEINKAI